MGLAYERRNVCLKWETTVCPKVDAYLKNLIDSARGIAVNCSNGQLFEVLTRSSHVVDLQVGECICREWQEHCSLYFSTQCYQNCYIETIKTILNQDKSFVDFENVEIKPPTTKRRAKKKKIPSQQ
ncbi:hypothetical protein Taro_026123 [Colocasia esculenta]|uniref:Uncharacterized protein n=1 Tax=Colocasia esculenta TaxID=4460 RepID=A0A843VML4_COLES|nr:hypothetical protein [Colocasia esculenta]